MVDDGTDTNETRLGAVKDIRYAIDSLGLDDDMLVIAGDNVLDFSLTRFMAYAGASASFHWQLRRKVPPGLTS